MAVISLVLGILGVFLLTAQEFFFGYLFACFVVASTLFGIGAIFLGLVARKQIKQSDRGGSRLALAGIIMGVLVVVVDGCVFLLVGYVFFIIIPGG